MAGGRNDTLAKGQPSPFLNDLYVYNLGVSLDKQQWYRVTLSDTLGNKDQELLNKVCNHTAAVWSDREHFDKLIILGGVQSQKQVSAKGTVTWSPPSLNGQMYVLNITTKTFKNLYGFLLQ